MKVKIEFDTEHGPHLAQITVDGRKLGYVQDIELRLSINGDGDMKVIRHVVGFGNKFINRREMRLQSRGGKWELSGFREGRIA